MKAQEGALTKELPLLIHTGLACEMLWGSSHRTDLYRLYAMIEREEIGAKKLGGRWFIPRAEMQKFIDADA